MTVKCEKISIRVIPSVKRGLQKLAKEAGLSLAELMRDCINESLEGLELPSLDDPDGWQRFMQWPG